MENTKEEDNSATLNTLVEIYKRAYTWDFQRQVLSIIAGQHSFEDVKKLIPEVTQYKFKSARKHCNQIGIGEPVSKTKQTRDKFDVGSSTLYKLLDECSALVRQSIEGLDNYVMEGCKAFKELESIVQQLDLTNIESKSLQENLQSAKRYLKSELKIQATRENRIADHCLSYALSSADINFKAACDHDHDLTCKDCVNIDTTVKCIKEKSETKEWKNKEATLYTVEESISAIRRWKCHVVRSRNQEEARCAIVEDMSSSDVVITCDWAMKFLPRKYREGHIDWFAKRGIKWHIAVSLLKNQSSFTTITHIHIFENPTAQDSAITTQILVDISKDIMAHRDDVNRIHFFSDNAGCYKSSSTLLTLQQELSSCIVSYNFCEAQNGKGPCDRRASHIKSIIKRYINEGNDVTTALQMKQAVDKEKKENLKVKVVTCLNILDETPRKCIIPNISQMYNFHFTERGLRMWKAFSVGEGRLLRWDYLGTPVKTIDLKTISDWMGGHISNTNEESQVVTDVSNSTDQTSTISVMECPLESCTKTFHSRKALDEHILMGNCNPQRVKMNISEKAKRLYAEKILSIQPQRKIVLESGHNSASECLSLEMGWAIKESKQRVAFTPCQKAYMVEKYNIGKVTGNKVDPYVAAEEMRNSGVFARSQYLSGQQISSFFSRMCQKEKKMTPEDIYAAEEEEKKDKIRNLLLDPNNN